MHQQTRLPRYFTPGAAVPHGSSWTHMDDVVADGREERVAADPLGAVTADGQLHLETPEQTRRWKRRRVEHADQRHEEAEDILELDRAPKKRKCARAAKAAAAAEADPDAEVDPDAEDEDEPPRFSRKGINRIQTAMATPVTAGDVYEQMNADAEIGLTWTPVLPPDEADDQQAMGGPPQPQEYCFGCAAGGPSVGSPAMDALAGFWRENRLYSKKGRLAKNVQEFYNIRIREITNRVAKRPGDMLGTWSAASIAEHFTRHDRSPETWQTETLRSLEGMQNHVLNNGCYNMNSKDSSDVRICTERAQLFMAIVKTYAMISKLKPQDMVGYAPDRSSGNAHGGPVINPRKNVGGVGPPANGRGGSSAASFVDTFL